MSWCHAEHRAVTIHCLDVVTLCAQIKRVGQLTAAWRLIISSARSSRRGRTLTTSTQAAWNGDNADRDVERAVLARDTHVWLTRRLEGVFQHFRGRSVAASRFSAIRRWQRIFRVITRYVHRPTPDSGGDRSVYFSSTRRTRSNPTDGITDPNQTNRLPGERMDPWPKKSPNRTHWRQTFRAHSRSNPTTRNPRINLTHAQLRDIFCKGQEVKDQQWWTASLRRWTVA